MGKMQRNKGRRAQTEAGHLLKDRDWEIVETSSGQKVEDFLATDMAIMYSVEVKSHKIMNIGEWRKQAISQAEKRKLPWMIMAKIPLSHSWLILRKNEIPVVWHQKTH